MRRDLWHELGKASLGQALRPEEPDPADLLAGQATVTGLPPHHFRVPADQGRHLLDG
jgi:hypothetical protein